MSSPESPAVEIPPHADWTPPEVEELASDFPALEIESLLAQGGMSAVYLARQRSLDRRVVLKVLPVEVGADAGAADRFMREARVLARLRDPGIVEIYDSGITARGNLFLVLEWEEGGDLRRWAAGETQVDEVLGIGESVCAALASAHAEDIIHGDIKPDNIFIDGKGRLKVGDFGLADFSGGCALFHTPGYTAPEIIDGTGVPSAQTDIYATGAMLFELLYKQLPPDTQAGRTAALTSLPPAAARAIGQMLHEDAAKRPATADACRKLLAETRRTLNAAPAPRRVNIQQPQRPVPGNAPVVRPGAAAGAPRTARPSSPARRKQGSGAGLMIGVAAVVLVGVGIWIWKSRQPGEGNPKPENPAPSSPKVSDSGRTNPPKTGNGLFDFPGGNGTTSGSQGSSAVKSAAVVTPPVPAKESAAESPRPADPALESLRRKYTTALTNAAKTAEQAKEAARLSALKAEIALLDKGGNPPEIDEPGTPAELAKLRAIYRKEADQILSPPAPAPATPAVVTPEPAAKPAKLPAGAPADAVMFKERWYRYYQESHSWAAARDKCESLHGRLACVPDKATWNFIKGLTGSKWTWLGATDERVEGKWLWVDGTPVTFEKWQKDEPNNKGGRQNYLRANSEGWKDEERRSDEVVGFICEWRP